MRVRRERARVNDRERKSARARALSKEIESECECESERVRRGRDGYQPIIIIACIISSMPAASPPIPPCKKVSVFVFLS